MTQRIAQVAPTAPLECAGATGKVVDSQRNGKLVRLLLPNGDMPWVRQRHLAPDPDAPVEDAPWQEAVA